MNGKLMALIIAVNYFISPVDLAPGILIDDFIACSSRLPYRSKKHLRLKEVMTTLSKTLTEQKVLKKLGIPDFRHMTKDKVVSFATMLPKMNPDVAKKALEQFPEFAASTKEIISYFKDTIDKGFNSNNDSVQNFYRTCDNIIATLEKQLEDGKLSFEEKNILIDKMISLAEMKSAKDTENKRFILDIVKTVGMIFGGCILCVASLLGLQTDALVAPSNEDSEDSDSGDEINDPE